MLYSVCTAPILLLLCTFRGPTPRDALQTRSHKTAGGRGHQNERNSERGSKESASVGASGGEFSLCRPGKQVWLTPFFGGWCREKVVFSRFDPAGSFVSRAGVHGLSHLTQCFRGPQSSSAADSHRHFSRDAIRDASLFLLGVNETLLPRFLEPPRPGTDSGWRQCRQVDSAVRRRLLATTF